MEPYVIVGDTHAYIDMWIMIKSSVYVILVFKFYVMGVVVAYWEVRFSQGLAFSDFKKFGFCDSF